LKEQQVAEQRRRQEGKETEEQQKKTHNAVERLTMKLLVLTETALTDSIFTTAFVYTGSSPPPAVMPCAQNHRHEVYGHRINLENLSMEKEQKKREVTPLVKAYPSHIHVPSCL
jgi:hypothetical protein